MRVGLNWWRWWLAAGLCACVAALAQERAPKRGTDQPAELYHNYCSVCHGERGDGRSRASNSLRPPPRDFTRASGLMRETMVDIVTHGKPGTAMVAWETQLSAQQIESVVDHIRQTFMPKPLSADDSLDLLATGRAVYNARCYFCHGYAGNGRTLAASFMRPAPTDFTKGQTQRLTTTDIVAVLRTGRAGTAMQSFTGLLSEAEMLAVAGFVRQAFVAKRIGNTGYHTAENGWPDHARYWAAYPFALGELALTQTEASLNSQQQQGRRLYLSSCITCHDRGLAAADSQGLP